MKTGKIRESRIARARLNFLSWSGRADWSPPPVVPKVRIRIEKDYSVRVSISPATLRVEDKVFADPQAAAIYAAGLMLEHAAEMHHD